MDESGRSHREFEFLIMESALRTCYLPPSAMQSQYHHIASLSSLSNVRIGIVSAASVLPILPYPFAIYDESLVMVEHGRDFNLVSRNTLDIQRAAETHDLLADLAMWGSDARELLYRLAATSSPDADVIDVSNN